MSTKTIDTKNIRSFIGSSNILVLTFCDEDKYVGIVSKVF